ncbi:Checkpoint protein hus1 [Ophidiomyces ophidiicola]|nr:Checkpoint protein hus1 [Ophidiomyces ophidiicola]KAI2015956.1 Checkpoint protein hus1 [Ophidiomyces ophidiicola]KAI2057214.1 Checkpoint protein hus1 [Ophidiomyces ophidiicola]KAI2080857.1 Checkpoint protein hus1 [Ophidiomyces ophidiicola]KAI2144257.1 Checkpoint protein hus1 [Ophidiomyces ophidiicola]
MRFRSQLTNIGTFTKFTASLSSLGKLCWVQLEKELVRFTVIPDQGSQVWAHLPIDAIFDFYSMSAAANVINLEVPIAALHRALKSAGDASSSSLRLTKKGAQPLLSLTVVTSSWISDKNALGVSADQSSDPTRQEGIQIESRERETLVTQEVPVRILHPTVVETLHEPRCRDPDVNIVLPSLIQLKSISERFNKLAMDTMRTSTTGLVGGVSSNPKLELSANKHGSLKLGISTDSLRVSSLWTGLANPEIDTTLHGQEIEAPSERMRALGGENGQNEEGWASVRIDGKDWGRVLSVGRLSPKVVACEFYAGNQRCIADFQL